MTRFRVYCSYMGIGYGSKPIPLEVDENDINAEYPSLAFFDTEEEALKHIKKIWIFQKPILDRIENDNTINNISFSDSYKMSSEDYKKLIN